MVDRLNAPELHSFAPYQIKQAETTFLESGNPVHFLISGTQPIIRIEFVFPAGTWFESHNGLSYLASKMLLEGTIKKSAREIADKIAFYGAFIETHQGFEHLNVTLYLLEKNLADVLPVIDEIFSESVFPDSELQNLKLITKQSLKVNQEKTQYLASVNFRKSLFGEFHPYGRQYGETEIEAVNKENIVLFAKDYLNWNNCEIFISGQFSISNVVSLLNKYTNNNSDKYNSAVFQKHTIQKQDNRILLIDKPSALQSSIKLGCLTIARSNPDFIPLLLLNEILGGFFGSRLMKNIREDKGFTYGIHSSIQTLMHAAYFVISTDVKRENTQETLDEIYKEIKILSTEPISEAELKTVTSYMIGRFMNSMTTPFALMDKFKTIYYSNLDYTYYNNFNNKLLNTSSDELNFLAKKYLDVDVLSKVIVGSL